MFVANISSLNGEPAKIVLLYSRLHERARLTVFVMLVRRNVDIYSLKTDGQIRSMFIKAYIHVTLNQIITSSSSSSFFLLLFLFLL